MESPRSSVEGGAGVGSVVGGGSVSSGGGGGGGVGSGRREARSNGRDRDRDRDRDRSRSPIVSKQSACRIFVSNLPYDYTWQQLKDLFREKIGEVTFAELYNDENGKAKGSGIVEFREECLVKKALDTMQRFEWGGRRIVVKDDYGVERDRFGSVIGGSRYSKNDGGSSHRGESSHSHSGRDSRHHQHQHHQQQQQHHHHNHQSSQSSLSSSSARKDIPSLLSANSNIPIEDIDFGNTYGLSRRFLANLKITSPLVNKVFVANLDYVVDEQKLREVFRLAGRVTHAEVYRDKEGKSRGVGVVEYEHPVESVQAISMLNNVQLYDRYITVRMDRVDNFGRLPEGLKSVGPGLGNNGEPLNNVALNLAISAIQTNGTESNNGGGGGGGGGSVLQSQQQQQSQTSLSSAISSVQQVANQTNAAAAAAALANPAAAVSTLIQSLAPLQNLTNVLTGAAGANPLFNSLGLAAAAAAAAPNPVDNVSNNYVRNTNVSRDYSTSTPAPQPVYDEKDFRSNSMYNSINNGVSGTVGTSGNQGGPSVPEPLLNQHQPNPVSDTLFLSNLPIGTSWPDLRERFLNYSIKYADIKPDGTGVIRFASDWEAERALKVTNKSFFEGRRIEAKFY